MKPIYLSSEEIAEIHRKELIRDAIYCDSHVVDWQIHNEEYDCIGVTATSHMCWKGMI